MEFYRKFITPPHPLNEQEKELHRKDLEHRYKLLKWTWKDVVNIITDLRIWPLIIMYFGVVGTGFGLAVLDLRLLPLIIQI